MSTISRLPHSWCILIYRLQLWLLYWAVYVLIKLQKNKCKEEESKNMNIIQINLRHKVSLHYTSAYLRTNLTTLLSIIDAVILNNENELHHDLCESAIPLDSNLVNINICKQ